MNWKPVFQFNSSITRALMDIEAVRAVIDKTPLAPSILTELRHQARVRSTHYSTRIEGNRLTLKEAAQVIEQKKASFHGRERDVNEVRNYWEALLKVEDWAAGKVELSENIIQRLHAIIEKGKRAKPTSYRDGQNVIRDARSGGIVYLPPVAKDVPLLMKAMVNWVKKSKNDIPAPVIAALLHYQFVTIHPFYDGNGRTARLLATYILQRDGYGLNGLFSLEEHHAKDLEGYYEALTVNKQHNYYMGRAEADLTGWVEYFLKLLAKVFHEVSNEASKASKKGVQLEPEELRRLDHRAKVVLALFVKKERITAKDIAVNLGLSDRMVRNLLIGWVKDGWLEILNDSNRARVYGLAKMYHKFIGL